MFEKSFLHDHEILPFVDFQDGGYPSSWNLKMKFLTANHFKDMFCIITLNFVEISRTAAEISHFLCSTET